MEEQMPCKWSPKLSPDATGFIRFPAIRNIVPLRSVSCLPRNTVLTRRASTRAPREESSSKSSSELQLRRSGQCQHHRLLSPASRPLVLVLGARLCNHPDLHRVTQNDTRLALSQHFDAVRSRDQYLLIAENRLSRDSCFR